MITATLSKELDAVIQQAHQYAERQQHVVLDSPHLFWALLKYSDAGCDWLGITDSNSDLIAKLEAAFGKWYVCGTDNPEPTATYIVAMRAAQESATASGTSVIAAGHLLKAVFEADSFLQAWLKEQGVRLLSVNIAAPTPLLDELGRDLTRAARRSELPPVVGREKEVRQLIEVLLRHGKNSALLLGLPGVGKTAVVERLAQNIAAGQVPSKLTNKRLIELNVSNFIAGTTYRGELEERIQRLLQEIQQTDDVIVVVDEFHMLMGAGKSGDSSIDVANILKPALARGDLTCIGITTYDEYTRHVEEDGAFARRFEKVIVSEPSSFDTRQILAGIVARYEKHHGLDVQTDALDMIVELAAQYLPMRQFPDKAIDILGIACSRAELQHLHVVTPELVTTIVSELAGVPVGHMTTDSQMLLTNLEAHLAQEVVGQNAAVAVLAKATRLAYTGLRDPQRPRGVFLFAGPSGVGKTQLAKSLAKQLFGDARTLLRLDMSEYAEKYMVSRLIGAAPGYIGYDEPGQLSQPLRNRPHTIVLLDEIEKAHPEVFDIFLQLFDEGRLTDSHGRLVDGRHALFIMTSNLGSTHRHKDSTFGFNGQSPELRSSSIEAALQAFFRPEFLNRVDHIVHFRELELDDLVEIAALELQMLKARMEARGVRLSYEQNVLNTVASYSIQKGAGARGIKRVVEELIAVSISDLLITTTPPKHRWMHVEVENGLLISGWI